MSTAAPPLPLTLLALQRAPQNVLNSCFTGTNSGANTDAPENAQKATNIKGAREFQVHSGTITRGNIAAAVFVAPLPAVYAV